MKKVANVISNVLIAIVLVFAIVLTVAVISSTKSDARLPNLFGKAILNVETDSMKGENGFDAGALIVVYLLTPEECSKLKVGDVITFRRISDGMEYLETHRIVVDTKTVYQNEVVDGIWVHGGVRNYMTKGDNTPDIDFLPDLSGPDYTDDHMIVGVWTGTAIPKLGSVMKFLQSQLGFLLCVVIPTALFFIWQLYKFISAMMEGKKQKAIEAVAEKEEEYKKKAIEEYLAAQAAQQAASAAAPDAGQAPPEESSSGDSPKE